MLESREQQWYAVRVKSRHEKSVAFVLNAKGYRQFLPVIRSRHKWADRTKDVELPLFAGYVFCCFNPDHRVGVLASPGVVDIVRSGRTLLPVANEEIESLQRVMDSRLGVEPWEYLQAGQEVQILRGPLAGLTGIYLQTKNTHRLVLSITLLQRSVLVEVDGSWVASPNALLIEASRRQAAMQARPI